MFLGASTLKPLLIVNTHQPLLSGEEAGFDPDLIYTTIQSLLVQFESLLQSELNIMSELVWALPSP